MKKLYFILIAFAAIVLTSCKAESCPPLYTTLTLELTCDAVVDQNSTDAFSFPAKKLELFTLQTYNSVITKYDVDLSESVPVLGADNKYSFKATVKIPFGEYSKMWIWGNVSDPMAYMPNKQSVRMFNNVAADWYMLLTSRSLSCNALNQTLQGDLKVLTAQVSVVNNLGADFKHGTSLFISNIYNVVDIEGIYSNSSASLTDVLQFELPATDPVPPATFYVFPQPETASNVLFTLSYIDNTDALQTSTTEVEMKTTGSKTVTFVP